MIRVLGSAAFDAFVWQIRWALSSVQTFPHCGIRFRASGSQFSRKVPATPPPPGTFGQVNESQVRVSASSLQRLFFEVFVLWTLACKAVRLSSAVDIRISERLTCSTQTVTSVFTFSIANKMPSKKVQFKVGNRTSSDSSLSVRLLFLSFLPCPHKCQS